MADAELPLSELPRAQKAERARSFGAVADDYERYRPGPPPDAVDWLLPDRVSRVIDLGAGTGRLTRLLVDRAEDVLAVEPDDRMWAVLARQVPRATPLAGRGEAIPAADGSVDAVVAATAWHWMDSETTLREVERVLVPGGVLGVMWTGAERDGQAIRSAQSVHERGAARSLPRSAPIPSAAAKSGSMSRRLLREVLRPNVALEIPPGMAFGPVERRGFTWTVPMDIEGLVGLLGTTSWVLTLEAAERDEVVTETRRFLAESLGPQEKVGVPFRAEVWRARRSA